MASCTATDRGFTDKESRACSCNEGYYGNGEPGQCPDISACSAFPCDINATCFEIIGGSNDTEGRNCSCNSGYVGNGEIGSCLDFPACLHYPCDVNAICIEIVGGTTDSSGRLCECNEGYVGDGTNCTDYPACKEFPCDMAARCTEIIGGPENPYGRNCTCNDGMYGSGEPGECSSHKFELFGADCVGEPTSEVIFKGGECFFIFSEAGGILRFADSYEISCIGIDYTAQLWQDTLECSGDSNFTVSESGSCMESVSGLYH
eukprot:TRINITY_DN38504_c0_g1_i2.p1 TRINITY_DN38504_c0_g1~~TRINITY_DN38504_c0_g1_i2.p1  ORF type:complete len:261 (+),score=16.19 TRINITY_DN38504_c0_g1_i2:196-978(+)